MFDFVADDTGCTLSVTCTDKVTGLPLNLSSSTVALHWVNEADADISRSMVISNALKGNVTYKFLAGELYAPSMSFEVVVTDAASKKITSLDTLEAKVRARLTP